jgi:ATP synthase protein I
LRDLGKRLGRHHSDGPSDSEPGQRPTADSSAMGRGLRLSSELIGGVIGGALIGWLLDRGLGIAPWGLIVFVLLGFAAGMLNLMRAAGLGSSDSNRRND